MVSAMPNATYFKPAGIPLLYLNEICLSVEEAEALRLKDLEGLEQVEGAISMGISRPTFQRILSSARKKVADALLNGKAIKIEGGNFQVNVQKLCCHKHRATINPAEGEDENVSLCPACDDEKIKPEASRIAAAEIDGKGQTEP
jgi:predicted DNA-binding protein (UPF0251 family)